ncbi:GNAT family N-acetyltransferase [Bradyrhizobium sp. LHD-71]|uniref:lipid II:glycine glycyltransferase FemX n=1 Tax=Bradyrhizobium sp. LHD-71 TaxID=3072141 RepID=UPI00280D9BAD|nr:GNAT family N-acetyltransferase [Bradyrhizobium sp. LHD-71]MDQ8726991.1 GNAT family N-acetyltransferase [Bradyrhizobium sp. LHD-71]
MTDAVLQSSLSDPAWNRDDVDRRAPDRAGLRPVFSHAIAPEQWDALAASFDGICQEQTCAFSAGRWPSLRLEPRLFRIGDEVVGGALVMTRSLPFGLGTLAICKWAPMLKNAERPDRLPLYRGMVEALIEEFANRRGAILSVLPRALAVDDDKHAEILSERGFRAGSNVPFPDRYLVNLQIGDAEQRASLDQKWRYHLKRAFKSGLTFERADASAFGEFDRLYRAMSERKKFPDYSAYRSLKSMFEMPEQLRPELFFVRKDAAIVAGAVIFKAGDTTSYMYGATTDEALPLRAGYFLQWQIIAWLRENTKARWYDLGGTDGFTGLHQFKKGLVGDAGRIVTLAPIAHYAASRHMLALGCFAFDVRDLLLEARHRVRLLWSDQARPDQRRPSSG